MNKEVNNYFIVGCGRCALGGTPACKVHSWEKELAALRTIIVDTGITEESKWGVPCYTYQQANVIILSALKDCVTVGFFKGALLANTEGILEKPGEHSQAARVIKFTSVQQVRKLSSILKVYIYEAIEIEKAGLKVATKKTPEALPDELLQAFSKNPVLKRRIRRFNTRKTKRLYHSLHTTETIQNACVAH